MLVRLVVPTAWRMLRVGVAASRPSVREGSEDLTRNARLWKSGGARLGVGVEAADAAVCLFGCWGRLEGGWGVVEGQRQAPRWATRLRRGVATRSYVGSAAPCSTCPTWTIARGSVWGVVRGGWVQASRGRGLRGGLRLRRRSRGRDESTK